jgi:hypothetical protein|tara:strand:- start:11499 stop:11606 length:108 start_codon:yes stop_codon:yes gene_type:complete
MQYTHEVDYINGVLMDLASEKWANECVHLTTYNRQ